MGTSSCIWSSRPNYTLEKIVTKKKELNVDEIVTITQVIFSKNTSNNFLINMLGV